jgi:hypothetical protein
MKTVVQKFRYSYLKTILRKQGLNIARSRETAKGYERVNQYTGNTEAKFERK